MDKRLRKVLASGIIFGSMVGGVQINPVNAYDNTSSTIECVQVSEDIIKKDIDKIINDSNYTTTKSVKEEIINENVKMITETIEYKPSSEKISNGTNFGTYSSIKFYSIPYSYYMGTVSVDVQGNKVSSTTAKINYIRYSNSGFSSPSKGAYKSVIHNQGNPAKGTVYVSYNFYDSGSFVEQGRVIPIKAYPTGNITIN